MENVLISACLLGIPCRYDGKSKTKIDPSTLEELKKRYNLIPICPEIYGGLPTPREGSEIVGNCVLMKDGTDVTENFRKGAEVTLQLAHFFGCRIAIMKERSPSCGKGVIHDGTFSGALTEGNGISTELLMKEGICVLGETEIEALI